MSTATKLTAEAVGDDGAVRTISVTRHENGSTEFCLRTLRPDDSERVHVHFLLSPEAVKVMATAMTLALKPVEAWPDPKHGGRQQ